MTTKIKTCSCTQCKASKARHRLEDKIVTKGINKKIRQANKKACNGGQDEENMAFNWNGYYWT